MSPAEGSGEAAGGTERIGTEEIELVKYRPWSYGREKKFTDFWLAPPPRGSFLARVLRQPEAWREGAEVALDSSPEVAKRWQGYRGLALLFPTCGEFEKSEMRVEQKYRRSFIEETARKKETRRNLIVDTSLHEQRFSAAYISAYFVGYRYRGSHYVRLFPGFVGDNHRIASDRAKAYPVDHDFKKNKRRMDFLDGVA